MAQTEIPIGNEIGRRHDPDEAFEREFGAAKAAEQRALYVEARRCTCGSAFPEKWGTRWKHKPPCPRAGKKF
jgi:hypothetical protein